MTCPYTSTRLASRLPTDNICTTCTIREALERRDEFARIAAESGELETSFIAGNPNSEVTP